MSATASCDANESRQPAFFTTRKVDVAAYDRHASTADVERNDIQRDLDQRDARGATRPTPELTEAELGLALVNVDWLDTGGRTVASLTPRDAADAFAVMKPVLARTFPSLARSVDRTSTQRSQIV